MVRPCIWRNKSIISGVNSRHSRGATLRRLVSSPPPPPFQRPASESIGTSDDAVRRAIWLAAPTHLFLMKEPDRLAIFTFFGTASAHPTSGFRLAILSSHCTGARL